MTDDGWKMQFFTCKIHADGKTSTGTIGGYVKGYFAIDPRWMLDENGEVDDRVWMINHLPTGFAIRGVLGSLDDAKAIVDALLPLWDWSFTDPDLPEELGIAAKKVLKDTVLAHRCLRALWLEGAYGA